EPSNARIAANGRLEQASPPLSTPEAQNEDKKITSRQAFNKKSSVTRASDALMAKEANLKKDAAQKAKANGQDDGIITGALQPETSNEITFPTKIKPAPQEQATTESAAVLDKSKQQTTGAEGNFYRTRPLPPTF